MFVHIFYYASIIQAKIYFFIMLMKTGEFQLITLLMSVYVLMLVGACASLKHLYSLKIKGYVSFN